MPRITKSFINQIVPDGHDQFIWDSALPGFGLRVSPTGAMSFLCQFRVSGRQQRRYSIGRFGKLTVEQARAEGQRILAMAQLGQDPSSERQSARRVPTFIQAYDEFLDDHAIKLKPKSAAQYHRFGTKVFTPCFKGLKVTEIERRDVTKLHRDMANTPISANRALSALSKFFNWCEANGIRPDHSNPCRHIKRYREHKRERYLSSSELRRLGEAICVEEQRGAVSHDAANAIRLLMLTGARLSEVLTLKWDYVDWERRLILLPDSKTGQKTIYLSAPVLELLEKIQPMPGNIYVVRGQKPGNMMTDIRRPWRIICQKADLKDLRIHDLRHSFASVAVSNGLSLPMIGKLLGHASTQTTARYAHLADHPIIEANELVGRAIANGSTKSMP